MARNSINLRYILNIKKNHKINYFKSFELKICIIVFHKLSNVFLYPIFTAYLDIKYLHIYKDSKNNIKR